MAGLTTDELILIGIVLSAALIGVALLMFGLGKQ